MVPSFICPIIKANWDFSHFTSLKSQNSSVLTVEVMSAQSKRMTLPEHLEYFHIYFLSRLLLVTFTSCHVYYLSRILLVTFTTCEEYFIARTIPSLSSLVYLLDNVDLFGFLVFVSSCSRWIFVWSKCFFLQDKSPHCLSIGLLLLLVMVLMLLLLFLMAEYLNRWTLSDSEWPLRDMALDHSFVTREIVMSNCN